MKLILTLTLWMLCGPGTELLVDVGPTVRRDLGRIRVVDHFPFWVSALVVSNEGRRCLCCRINGRTKFIDARYLHWRYILRLIPPGCDRRS